MIQIKSDRREGENPDLPPSLARAEREARAILFGGAIGDALGWPVEFLQRAGILRRFGSRGIVEPPTPAEVTDDTEMTLALGRALAEVGERSRDAIMDAVSRQYVRWLDTHNPRRAPGASCLAGARALKDGISWVESGVVDGRGCGAAMRVAPVGYLYQHNLEKLMEIAAASAQATHRAPSAVAAAVGVAHAVKLALDGVEPQALVERVVGLIPKSDHRVADALQRWDTARKVSKGSEALKLVGLGWEGHEALLMALLCVERQPESYVRAVRLAANIDGDSDSVASIVGSIQGARLGLQALPTQWLDRLEMRPDLEALARGLAQKKCEIQLS